MSEDFILDYPYPSHHFTFYLSATSAFSFLHQHLTFHSQPSHINSPFNTFIYLLKYHTKYISHTHKLKNK